MKILRLLLLGFGLLPAMISSAQTINYRLVNPRIIKIGAVDKFEFYIQVMASHPGTYLWSGQVSINFNNTALSSTVSDWTATKIPSNFSTFNSDESTPKYNTLRSTLGGYFLLAFVPGDNLVLANGPNSADFYEIPDVWTTLYKVSCKITDINGVAGINIEGAAMNGQQSYINAINSFALYDNSIPWNTSNFTNTYLGRLYSNASGWSQVGNSTTAQWVDWTIARNTSIYDEVSIPSGSLSNASALRIQSGAILTVPSTGQLTVTGNTEINMANGLVIQSDDSGTGSLITGTASGEGSAVAQRWMTANAWHIVSSPLSGQTISNFLETGNLSTIATNGNARGMMDYNPEVNIWNPYFNNLTVGNLETGKGFSMRVGASDAKVSFTGLLQTGALSASVIAGYWNCIGNPYTSAIGITTASASSSNFLNVNAANFESSYGAIYVWNKPDASNGNTGNYTTISNTAPEFNDVQQGQAFMVNMKAGVSSLSFSSAMQIHNSGLGLKSTDNLWPTIKLEASVGSQKSSTIIAFNSGMTNGLDITYDAGLLKGNSDLIVYSKLVEDNGIAFAIQALPTNAYSSMIIPIGLDFKTGGDVVFSSEMMNLPSDCNVILEDKILNKLTDLSNTDYTVTIASNSSTSDRFRLHTSYQTTGLDESNDFDGKLSAYSIRNTEILVKGTVSNQAIATLYDIQGRIVLVKNLEEGSMNIIPTPNIKTGIYMLFVKDNNKIQGFKIPVKE